MKVTAILVAVLVVTPALHASDKSGPSQPQTIPQYWVKIDSVDLPQLGRVECVPNSSPKPVNVHISYNQPYDGDIARVDAGTAGEANLHGVGYINLSKGAGTAVVPTYFNCTCPSGKSSYSIDRLQAWLQAKSGKKAITKVQPLKLTVDCPPKGPSAPLPFTPPPVGQPHPVNPGDAVQQKKG